MNKILLLRKTIRFSIKYILLVLFFLILSCSRENNSQVKPTVPHPVFSNKSWSKELGVKKITSMGIGTMKIQAEGKSTDKVLSVMGKPSYRIQKGDKRPSAGFSYIDQSGPPKDFDEQWIYLGKLEQYVFYFKEGKVVLALYHYSDY